MSTFPIFSGPVIKPRLTAGELSTVKFIFVTPFQVSRRLQCCTRVGWRKTPKAASFIVEDENGKFGSLNRLLSIQSNRSGSPS